MNENEKENEKKFKPNPKQLKYSEVFLNYKKPRSNKEIAKEISVSTMTIYRWRQQSGFIEWLNSLAKDLLKKSLAKRYMVGIKEAEQGNYNFYKLMMEIQGIYTPQLKQQIDQEPMQIRMVNVDRTGEALREKLIEKLDLIRSRISPKQRKQYLLNELKEIEEVLKGIPKAKERLNEAINE